MELLVRYKHFYEVMFVSECDPNSHCCIDIMSHCVPDNKR
jgi:hypothetical protein